MEKTFDEEIYYGDIYTKMYPCKGIFRAYRKEYIKQEEVNENSILVAIKYADDLSYIKEEYKDHYVPCVPETLIKLENTNIENDKTEIINSFICQPLLKFKEIKNLTPCFKAIVSGHRSAILKDEKNNIYYRLKGCGNDQRGFNLLKGEGYFKEFNTRGHQYDCTCPRELYYSERVNESLKSVNIPCGNQPIGFWKYDKNLEFIDSNNINSNEMPKPENEVPEVDKYCGIFITLGDKRLRTHLLGGLEIIIKTIADLCISKGDINEDQIIELKKIFPKGRFNDIRTYLMINSFSPPIVNGKQLLMDEWCKNPIYDKEKYKKIISSEKLKEEIKNNKNMLKLIENSDNLTELYSLLSKNLSSKNVKKIKILMDKLLEEEKKDKSKSILKTILDIYIRVGYECGTIKRYLQDAHINWGSYIDHGSYNFHCNAHSNNFIVLPQGYDSLLAPVDFDLAFSKEKSVNIYKDSNTFGQQDFSFYENYINTEVNELSTNLCGAEDYNFDFSKKENLKSETLEEKLRDIIKYLFCDCLLENYMKSFDKIKSIDVIDSNELKKNSFLHDIVKIALILTSQQIA